MGKFCPLDVELGIMNEKKNGNKIVEALKIIGIGIGTILSIAVMVWQLNYYMLSDFMRSYATTKEVLALEKKVDIQGANIKEDIGDIKDDVKWIRDNLFRSR